jgi:hypothetical protein
LRQYRNEEREIKATRGKIIHGGLLLHD